MSPKGYFRSLLPEPETLLKCLCIVWEQSKYKYSPYGDVLHWQRKIITLLFDSAPAGIFCIVACNFKINIDKWYIYSFPFLCRSYLGDSPVSIYTDQVRSWKALKKLRLAKISDWYGLNLKEIFMKCIEVYLAPTGTESSTNTIHLSIAEFVFISRSECLWDAPWFIQTNAVVRERRRCYIVITRFSFQGDTDTISTLIIHKLNNQSSGDRKERGCLLPFFAPTGAQGMLMSGCLCAVHGKSLSKSI